MGVNECSIIHLGGTAVVALKFYNAAYCCNDII